MASLTQLLLEFDKMLELIYKVIVLFLDRKDKYKLAEEQFDRRIKYVDDLKKIEELKITETEKHALRNSAAQALVGNRLASYNLVNYIFKNTKVVNIETIARVLAFWDTCLIIDKDPEGNIINIQINKKGYIQEKLLLFVALVSAMIVFLATFFNFKIMVNFLKVNFLLPESISLTLSLVLFIIIFSLNLLLMVMTIVVYDLRRIIKLVQS